MTTDESWTLQPGDVIEIEEQHRQGALKSLYKLVWLRGDERASVQHVRQMDQKLTTISDIQLLRYRKTGERQTI